MRGAMPGAPARRDMLRFLSCGSVDDGKSTLIGRLLHDSDNVYTDHLAAVRRAPADALDSYAEHDLALLLDGLRAEREQGITIDVAYRYFSTPRRKFIIADCPGHEQYTRNMITGGSTARLAVLLVDASRGLTEQTRRHAFLVSLLEIAHVVVAVNKMDAVAFDPAVFERIRAEYVDFAARLSTRDVHFIPLSALRGDNVVHRSEAMPWYEGPPLLEHLENVYVAAERNLVDLRFPVQHVLRPPGGGRVYAGTVASGVLRPGAEVMVLPSRKRTRVRDVLAFERKLDEAFPPMAVGVTTEDELDIGRGDVLVHPRNLPQVDAELEAILVWMGEEPLDRATSYVLKIGCTLTRAQVIDLRYRFDVNTIHRVPAQHLELNQIGRARLRLLQPAIFDPYTRNGATGSAILIDPVDNRTVGALMILQRAASTDETTRPRAPRPVADASSVSGDERAVRVGHESATVWLRGAADVTQRLAGALERGLFDAGLLCFALTSDSDDVERDATLLQRAGVIAIVAVPSGYEAESASADPSGRHIDLHVEGGDAVEELLERCLAALNGKSNAKGPS